MRCSVKNYMEIETGVSNMHFTNICDYIVVIIFLLKQLEQSKKTSLKIIKDFETYAKDLKQEIPTSICNQIIGTDFRNKIGQLRGFV